MFSRILVKLIDESILPAVVLLAARIVTVTLVGDYFGANVGLDARGFIFQDHASFKIVNSYSIAIMGILIALGMLLIVIKSFVFHSSHISPGLTAKLYAARMHSLIQTSFDLYTQGAIWLSYAYLMTLVSGLMSFFNIVYPWVFQICGISTVVLTILFIFDVENEFNISQKKEESLNGALE